MVCNSVVATALVGVLCIGLFVPATCGPSACTRCQQSHTCIAPDCFCCRDELNLQFNKAEIPQIVFFTFDDAVTDQVAGFYRELFDEGRTNPNGCPITMTLFISHENTRYPLVSEFYKRGMEIASHSVTHNTMNSSNFFDEAKTQKANLAKLAKIPIDEIKGWRSPFLKPTGDLQPNSLQKLGYEYDATLTFSKRSYNEKPPSPFTLDYGWPYECQVKPCPKTRHAGFWEVPIVSLLDYKHKYDCVYVDGCMNAPPDENSAYKFLWDNFNSYYTSTRVPFGINMHPSWFYYPDRLKAMDRFIQKLVSLQDVYIVSARKTLDWLKDPTPLSQLRTFAPWSCKATQKSLAGSERRRQPPFSWNNRFRNSSLPAPPSFGRRVGDNVFQLQRTPPTRQTPAPVRQATRRQLILDRLEGMRTMMRGGAEARNQQSFAQLMQRREQQRREQQQRRLQLQALRRREYMERQKQLQLQRQHRERIQRQNARLFQQSQRGQRGQMIKQEAVQPPPIRQRLWTSNDTRRVPKSNDVRNKASFKRTEPAATVRAFSLNSVTPKPTASAFKYKETSRISWAPFLPKTDTRPQRPQPREPSQRPTTENPLTKQRRLQQEHLRRQSETIQRQKEQQELLRKQQIAQLRKQQQDLQRKMVQDIKRQQEQQKEQQRLLRLNTVWRPSGANVRSQPVRMGTNQTGIFRAGTQPRQPNAWNNFIRMILGPS